MKIAIDESPITSSEKLSHRVRGVGYYIKNLKASLKKSFPEENFIYFSEKKQLPLDVSLIHYPYFEPFFITLPFSKTPKTIVTVHDLTPLVFPKNFPVGIKGKIKWETQKRLLQRCERVITDSLASKKDLIKIAGIKDDKIDVVYLAASEAFRPATDEKNVQNMRKKYNLPDTFALYVGDVTWNKNLPRLMRAMLEINVPLVLVGKAVSETGFDKTNPWNQDRLEVQKIIKENPLFISLGFVPDEDIPYLYNCATVFVMPSLYEGFGLPLLEAMSSGTPIVTSNKGSIPEVVGNAAEIVDAYDISSIAQGVTHVINDQKVRQTLIRAGLVQAKKFSWTETARKTYDAYKRALLSP